MSLSAMVPSAYFHVFCVASSRAPTASFHDSKHSIVHIHYEATTGNLLTSGTDKVIKVRVPRCSSYNALVTLTLA